MKCIECGRELNERQSKFCSKKCNNAYYRKHHGDEFKEYKNNWEKENMERRKQEKEDYAKNHGFDSLNKLTYLHQKIRESKPKPEYCPICHEKKKLQLASIDHTYTEDPKDYLWLCQSCHYWFDTYSGEKDFKLTNGKETEFNAGYVKGLEEAKEIIKRKNNLLVYCKSKEKDSLTKFRDKVLERFESNEQRPLEDERNWGSWNWYNVKKLIRKFINFENALLENLKSYREDGGISKQFILSNLEKHLKDNIEEWEELLK